jgi:putative ABC transport system substrate-binding protein
MSVSLNSMKLHISLELADLRRQEDLETAFTTMISKGAEALVVVPGPLVYFLRKEIADAALMHRLPAIITVKHFTQAGLLMSYGPDLDDEFRRAATYVDKILNGAAPGDLPVEQPTSFEFVINLKTAKALGVSIPAALVATANEVIE